MAILHAWRWSLDSRFSGVKWGVGCAHATPWPRTGLESRRSPDRAAGSQRLHRRIDAPIRCATPRSVARRYPLHRTEIRWGDEFREVNDGRKVTSDREQFESSTEVPTQVDLGTRITRSCDRGLRKARFARNVNKIVYTPPPARALIRLGIYNTCTAIASSHRQNPAAPFKMPPVCFRQQLPSAVGVALS